jgi:hypothetical protein
MFWRATAATLALGAAVAVLCSPGAAQGYRHPELILVSGPATTAATPESISPEEKMRRRHPQPVRVGDLIGLPLLDDGDRTIGRVREVVRTGAGKIQLIVPYGGFFGWGRRPVAVPIEVVAIAGRQLAALDMTRLQLDAAPTWSGADSQPIPPGETIRIALYRR